MNFIGSKKIKQRLAIIQGDSQDKKPNLGKNNKPVVL